MRIGAKAAGAAGLRDYFERLKGGLIGDGVLAAAAGAVKESILKRTSSGLDAEGRPFKPYSKDYEKRRKKAGRPVGTVDLEFSGKMKRDVVLSVDGPQASITFSTEDGRAKARRLQGLEGRAAVKRNFFAPGPAEKDLVAGIFSEHVDRVLNMQKRGDTA